MAEETPKTLVKAGGFFKTKQDEKFAQETSKGLVKVSSQMLAMQTLLRSNITSLGDAVEGDSEKKQKLANVIQNLTNIEGIQNKIVDGQELNQKEAKKFVDLSGQVVGTLKDLNLQFDVNFSEIVSSLKGTLTDTGQDIEDRRKLVKQINDLAKEKGVNKKVVDDLDKLLESNLNFTGEQTKQVVRLVDEVTKDKAFQSKSIATLDQINNSLDASVLTQDELKGLLDQKDSGGQTFSQKFIENPGVFAANNQVKTGALSAVFGAAGLGGIDTALGLSEKLSIEGLAKGSEKIKGFFGKKKESEAVGVSNADATIKQAIKDAPVVKEDTGKLLESAVKSEPLNAIKPSTPDETKNGSLLSQAQIIERKLKAPVIKEDTGKLLEGIEKIVENTDVDARTNTEINKEKRQKKTDKKMIEAIKALSPKEGGGSLLSQSQIVDKKLKKADKKKQEDSSSSFLGDMLDIFSGKKRGGKKKVLGRALRGAKKFLGKRVGKGLLSQGAKFVGKRAAAGLGSSVLGGGAAALVGPALLAATVGMGAFKGTKALTKFLAGDPDKKFKDKTTTEKVGTVLSGGGGGFAFDAINKGKSAKFVTVNPAMSIKDLAKAKKTMEIQLQDSRLSEEESTRIKTMIKAANKFIKRKQDKEKTISESGIVVDKPSDINKQLISQDQSISTLRPDGLKVVQTATEKEKQIVQAQPPTPQPVQNVSGSSEGNRQSRGNGVDDLGLTVMNSLVFE